MALIFILTDFTPKTFTMCPIGAIPSPSPALISGSSVFCTKSINVSDGVLYSEVITTAFTVPPTVNNFFLLHHIFS